MDNIIELINGDSWADWSLDKLEIDYDKVDIIVSSENDVYVVRISCKDYIGFSYIGHWDESIIKDIKVEEKGNLIDESLQTVEKFYGKNPLPGGGTKNIFDKWYQINIKLIDGNTVEVVCKNFEIKE